MVLRLSSKWDKGIVTTVQGLLLDLVESVSFQDPLGKGERKNTKIKSKFSTTLCNGTAALFQMG